MKAYIIFLTIMLLTIFGTDGTNAQCNDTLVKQAIMESGHDAVFLKEFKVKFKKGKANRPARVAKYSVFMKDSTTYRFNVVNAEEFNGKAILQLYNKDKLLGSTYDFEILNDKQSFDITCKKTKTYQVLMSFIKGEAGCAVGIFSMVVNDSTVIPISEFPESLYVGIKNPLYIAYTDEPGCSVHVFSDQGTIKGQNGKYTITPDTVGPLVVTAQTIDERNNIKEEIQKRFNVVSLPTPYISINGNTGGLIFKFDLLNVKKIDLHVKQIFSDSQYEIVNFTISDHLFGISGKKSDSNFLSFSQRHYIESLEPGDQFFIINIKVRDQGGNILELKPAGFIIH